MSAAADLKVVRVCLKRMDFATSWLVIMDDLSNFVSLEPAEACTAEVTAKYLLIWCKTMEVPRVWVSDTATHFKNRVITQLSDALKVDHRFAVAYTPWSNGTCEPMVREVVRALKSMLSEPRKQVAEWVDVLPAARWALITWVSMQKNARGSLFVSFILLRLISC